ncbi:MAG TPA: hypothetical protein VL463_32000 [Kofleriaceae bacterium]|nr:hypothetical protein [Kofleriaceae bacterium]
MSIAVRECEEACRAHAASCLAASDKVDPHDPDREECTHLILDCAYASSAAARALRHFQRGDSEIAVLLTAACAKLATRCASACDVHRALDDCTGASRECASACDAVLDILGVRPVIAGVEREQMFGGSAA